MFGVQGRPGLWMLSAGRLNPTTTDAPTHLNRSQAEPNSSRNGNAIYLSPRTRQIQVLGVAADLEQEQAHTHTHTHKHSRTQTHARKNKNHSHHDHNPKTNNNDRDDNEKQYHSQ